MDETVTGLFKARLLPGLGVNVGVGTTGVFVDVEVGPPGVAVGGITPVNSCAPISNAPPCGMLFPKKSRVPTLVCNPNVTRFAPALMAGELDCSVNELVGKPLP